MIFWCCLIATAAVAGEEHKMKVKVVTDSGDGSEPRVVEWHDDGTTIDDLEVGESKTITDDHGNEITLTRTEKGLEVEVEGENIELPHDKHANMVFIGDGDTEDVIIKEHKMIKVVKADHDAGVTIISKDEIDDETRAKIEKLLKESGKDVEVMFIDGSELHGEDHAGSRREVRVIKKKSDATN